VPSRSAADIQDIALGVFDRFFFRFQPLVVLKEIKAGADSGREETVIPLDYLETTFVDVVIVDFVPEGVLPVSQHRSFS
jgi:hypothetical protein